MKQILKDKLKVRIFEDRQSLGSAAAEDFFQKVKVILETKEFANIVFASAPSQNEFLAALSVMPVEWNRVNAFHMDEYVGLPSDAPQGFGTFLKERLFDKVTCREVHYINGNSDPEEECKRYAALLLKYPTDIVCFGIGENTHLAFNDPHVANFKDPEIVKVVDLDNDCRLQQVNDGCFTSLEEVPTHAITITIPALFETKSAIAVVPGKLKANAIYNTLNSIISEQYPSTILRIHPDTTLYIDINSAEKIL